MKTFAVRYPFVFGILVSLVAVLRQMWPMSKIMSFIKKRQVLTYFVLTFALSWSGILLVTGGPGKIPVTPEQTERLFPTALVGTMFATRFRTVDGAIHQGI